MSSSARGFTFWRNTRTFTEYLTGNVWTTKKSPSCRIFRHWTRFVYPLRFLHWGNVAGPFLGLMLADFGASVVKIDRIGSVPAFDVYCNRGKKSFACDLKHPKATEAIEKLIATAGMPSFLVSLCCSVVDVLIEPFRPGVMEKVGLGPEHCLTLNPRLIYTRLTGFGQTGMLNPGARMMTRFKNRFIID
jgi:hypothetical protein